MIKSGEFDRVLLRPRSTALQIAGREIQLMRVGRLTQGLAVLFWATNALDISWSVPRIAITIGAILGGTCLFAGLMILQATLAFWTTESLEIVNTMTYGGVETAQFPLPIYSVGFRRFFIFVISLGCVTYFPALAILDRPDPLGAPEIFRWVAPIVGVLFLGLSLGIWQFGVRHYISTGT